MSPKHIVVINQHASDMLGGSEIQCDIISRTLTAHGHRVTYLAVDGDKTKNYATSYAVDPVRRNADAISAAAIAARPDIVYWRFNKHCFHRSVKAIKQAGIPIVFSVSHIRDVQKFYVDPDLLAPPISFSKLRRAAKECFRLAREHRGFAYIDAVASLNEALLEHVEQPQKKRYIPNSMPTDAVPFEWPRDYCVWVANLKDRKRPEKYIELAEKLGDLDIDFLMVGNIQSRKYEQIVANAPPNLHFLGGKSVSEVNGIIAQSRFLVHTCLPEGFGNNFIQAWLLGKTAISLSFDPGGLMEKEQLGICANDDMAAFVRSTRELIENPERTRQLGAACQRYAEQHFSAERNVRLLEELFADVLNNQS